ncbi:MAG: D-alanine aminotransferase [Syntrophaceae bacterium PtaU1.Bin231]|nr:MAG: D-alanine aminotransferase [Syntrophaceae bacterium PtaB.Bin038]OPY90745.1 MAG: D-alanine aminotransferase [Syntrophaceae bacterium PtaU1.Bin231]
MEVTIRMLAYFNGIFLRREEIHISPNDRGFLVADGVYEVVRAYGGTPFRMAEHMDRLARSLRETRIDFPCVADLAVAGTRLIALNGLEKSDSILHFQVTRGVAPRKHTLPDPPRTADEDDPRLPGPFVRRDAREGRGGHPRPRVPLVPV